MKKRFLIILVALLWCNVGVADIYKAKAFKCTYYHTAVGEVKNNKYKVDSESEDNFGFSIVNINFETKKSQMVGNVGTDNMTAISANPSGIHFFQMMPIGNATMTTIYPQEVGINRLGQILYTSSHSRHIAMDNKSLPQQFYGECAKLE